MGCLSERVGLVAVLGAVGEEQLKFFCNLFCCGLIHAQSGL